MPLHKRGFVSGSSAQKLVQDDGRKRKKKEEKRRIKPRLFDGPGLLIPILARYFLQAQMDLLIFPKHFGAADRSL
jgi:hypothetical protein